jgi:hypothetical protein
MVQERYLQDKKKLNEKDYLEDAGVDGKIIFKLILNEFG